MGETALRPFSYSARDAFPRLRPVAARSTNLADSPAVRHRTRLWEMNGAFHCSIIGTCLTTSELRRVMGRVAMADVSGFSDHALHTDAVNLCGQHNAGSKLLQKALDGRHGAVLKRFAALRGEAAVMEKWDEARRAGDIPGAYWGVLTHPEAGPAALRRAFGDVHMLSHLVGAANRADIRRLSALEAENAALLAKVERQQARLQAAIVSRDLTIRRLGALAATRVNAEPSDDGDALAGLRHLVADLQDRLAAETGRRERLERRLGEACDAGQAAERRAQAAEAGLAGLERELVALNTHLDAAQEGQRALLPQRVLYVGGRPGAVGAIREALAAAGGELLYHDGGQHDHPSLLPGLISQADRVVFPVDCVSHDAALTVKRVCRQFGKPWFPLRSSGLASFLAVQTGQ